MQKIASKLSSAGLAKPWMLFSMCFARLELPPPWRIRWQRARRRRPARRGRSRRRQPRRRPPLDPDDAADEADFGAHPVFIRPNNTANTILDFQGRDTRIQLPLSAAALSHRAVMSLVSGRQRSSGSPTCECITKLIDQEGVGSFTRYVNDCWSPPLLKCITKHLEQRPTGWQLASSSSLRRIQADYCADD